MFINRNSSYFLVPSYMKSLTRWAEFSTEEKDGRVSKTPLQAVEGALGKRANCRETSHFTSFQQALDFHKTRAGQPAVGGTYTGLSFALFKEDGIVAIDLDHCVTEEGELKVVEKNAAMTVMSLGGVAEVSTSGTGLHAFVRGSIPKARKKDGVELYDSAKIISMTGNFNRVRFDQESEKYVLEPLAEGEEVQLPEGELVQDVLDDLVGVEEGGGKVTSQGTTVEERALAAVKRRFRKNYKAIFIEGDRSAYKSPSEARWALVTPLAWAFGNMENAREKIEEHVLSSKLYERASECFTEWDRLKESEIDRALASFNGHFYVDIPSAGEDGRVEITYLPGREDACIREVCAALADRYYTHEGSQLVEIRRRENKNVETGRVETYPAMETLTKETHRANALSAVSFRKYSDKLHDYVPDSPAWPVVDLVLFARDFWDGSFRPLRGIASTPFFRSDGTLVNQEGYDEKTWMYVDFNGEEFPEIPQYPTQEEMEVSKTYLLNELLPEFPFNSQIDKAVAIAAFLTIPIKNAVKNIPLIAISASDKGSGKSTLSSMLLYTLLGMTPISIELPMMEEERTKTIQTALHCGSSTLYFDNLSYPLSANFLNTVLTEEKTKFRVLGGNTESSLDTSGVLVVANGNNLAIEKDLTRRSLCCYLNPPTVNPAERKFMREDPREWIKKHRGEVFGHLMTVLLWQRQHDDGEKLVEFGSFEAWSRAVRRTCVYTLGLPDPFQSQVKLQEEDPEAEELREVFEAWHHEFGCDSRVSSHKVIDAVEKPKGRDHEGEVYAAFQEIFGKDVKIGKKALTMWMKRHANKRVYLVIGEGEDEKLVQAYIEKTSDDTSHCRDHASYYRLRYVEEVTEVVSEAVSSQENGSEGALDLPF